MVRLFKGVSGVIKTHMQHEESLIAKSPNLQAEPGSAQRRKVTELKQGAIAFGEYKEYCHLIQKLIETAELFHGVNADLI